MNRQTLLSIYERLEAIISKLPGPLQNAVTGELKPIKEIFLSQRLARIVLVGKANADASSLLVTVSDSIPAEVSTFANTANEPKST